MTGEILIAAEDGGWLISSDEAPIGYIDAHGSIMTPGGLIYTVTSADGGWTLLKPEGGEAVTLSSGSVRDAKTGVEWDLREGWPAAYNAGRIALDDVWVRPYTLEDAQGVVPNRVKLLLAWIVTRSGDTTG